MLKTEVLTLENGKKLRLARQGKGAPLVFLHGYPDNLQIWSRLVETLSQNFLCIAIDWPGMGASEAWAGGAAPKHMADRLHLILNELKIESPILVAMDMGGQAALEFAIRFPERLEKLVIMNSLVFGDEETSWEIELLRKYGWNRWILNHLPRVVFARAQSTFLPKGSGLTGEVLADLWSCFRRDEVRSFISKMCAGYQGTLPELAKRYPQIKTPVLILWGEKDKHFPVAQAHRLHKTISGSRLEILDKAWHWMVWSDKDRIAKAIERFAGT